MIQHTLESDHRVSTPDPSLAALTSVLCYVFCSLPHSPATFTWDPYSVRLCVRLALLDVMHFLVIQVNVFLGILGAFVYFNCSYDGIVPDETA